MTEAEWLAATDPTPMLEFLWERISERKLRLFAVACCWRISHLLPCEELTIEDVIVAEGYADGLVSDDSLQEARERAADANGAIHRIASTTGWRTSLWIQNEATGAVGGALETFETWRYDRRIFEEVYIWAARALVGPEREYLEYHLPEGHLAKLDAFKYEQSEQGQLLRCILGNPFHPVTIDPSWLTSTVLALAQGIYEERAFDRMPILADALQDARCDNEDILKHCREQKEHVRGCFVVDLLLGKS